MKEQTAKHEWENTGWGVLECKNCPVKSVSTFGEEGKKYYLKYLGHEIEVLTEPPCITRKIDDSKNEAPNSD